ncbi:NAD-dependent epimerase/dehydratase family protein [Dyella koreensis]|uniref:UDP-glucose 4-epimerase n=1 Tax=Dyella koreensis TaxID=311235 RepID=A0ABW8K972_9GAMM
MKCLVLGGGGFIGSAVVDRLLRDGHAVRVFERPRVEPFRSFEPAEDVEWVTGDLQSVHDVREALTGVDVVLHLVSTTLPKSSNDDPIYDVQSNVLCSIQILQLMVELGIKRIVFISSGGTVYGIPQIVPIPETHPTNPEVSYGISKLAIEKYLYLFNRLHGIKPVIFRVANPYGERQRVATAQGAIAAFVQRALRGEHVEIWGDGSVERDYIYVSDVADAFSAALAYQGERIIFNIGSGGSISLNGLVDILEKAIGRSIERCYLPGRPFDVPVNSLDTRLAQSELGWTPNVSLADGLNRTIRWVRAQLGH